MFYIIVNIDCNKLIRSIPFPVACISPRFDVLFNQPNICYVDTVAFHNGVTRDPHCDRHCDVIEQLPRTMVEINNFRENVRCQFRHNEFHVKRSKFINSLQSSYLKIKPGFQRYDIKTRSSFGWRINDLTQLGIWRRNTYMTLA